MTTLPLIEQFLNHTLQSANIRDYAPNGVQVRGKDTVRRVVTGVSASQELFDAAVAQHADLILVHHGLFWDKEPRIVEGSLKRRLKTLLNHDITLMAYHLPLDCHPVLGNNIQIVRALGLNPVAPFGLYHGTHLSFIGETPDQIPLAAFVEQVRAIFGGEPLVLPFGPASIQRIAICSGGAPELAREAKAKGADLFLSGEASEPLYHYAKEEGLHVVAAGHHRSERFGVQALGALLAEQFSVEQCFIDCANPL